MSKEFVYEKPDNLVDLFEQAAKRFKNNPLYGTKDKNNQYQWVTYGQVHKRVDRLRTVMAGINIGEGDAVGIIAKNSVEFAVVAFATYGRKGRFVPMYVNENPKIWEYIVRDAGIKLLFVPDSETFKSLKHLLVNQIDHIFLLHGEADNTLPALENSVGGEIVAPLIPDANDIAALIYTSGTTGDPKGVLLSHGNFTSNARAGWHIFPILNEQSRSLSILPWGHSYGQTAELYNWLQFGGSIGFAGSVETIADDLAAVKPTFLLAVPRIFYKIYDGINAKMNQSSPTIKKLFEGGLAAIEKKEKGQVSGFSALINSLKIGFIDKLIYKKIRQKFGGRLEGALSGSATMNVEIARFFHRIGIPVYDCYGLSETSPAITMNGPANFKLGTVGRPIEFVKVVIDTSVTEEGNEDGEIVAYGPNVMQGYHNKPNETAKIMTKDGGLRTGDVGKLDSDGYLSITGRIKEQYKLSNGKYVFPEGIEEEIKRIPYIENAMLYGVGRSFNICLIVPNSKILHEHAVALDIRLSIEDLIHNVPLLEIISLDIQKHLEGKYASYEIPKRFIFLEENFTLENGSLTQTLKLKRRVVRERFKDLIEKVYEDDLDLE